MFTVLIAEKEHIEAIREKNKLFFEPFLENQELALCQWNPEGQNLYDSVPGLLDAVGCRKKWRAVIIQKDSEDSLRMHNPFDVIDNSAVAALHEPDAQPQSDETMDSWEAEWTAYHEALTEQKHIQYENALEQPLQKLSTWLCFTPTDYILNDVQEKMDVQDWAMEMIGRDDLKFSARLEVQEREQYKREIRMKELLRRKFVEDEYLDVEYPTEIYCIALRTVDSNLFDPSVYWDIRQENEYSTFTDRNMYFDKMRFMVFDILPQTHRNYRDDYIRFLASVLVFATNPVQSSALQVRRLYRIETKTDNTPLRTLITSYDKKLATTLSVIDAELDRIRSEIPGEMTDKQAQTMFCTPVDIAVPVNEMSEPESIMADTEYGLSFDSPQNEYNKWDADYRVSNESLGYIMKQRARSVRRSVKRTSLSSEVSNADISRLTALQIDDVREFTESAEDEMIASIPPDLSDSSRYTEPMKQKAAVVEKTIQKRMTTKTTVLLSLLCLGLYFMSFLPFLIRNGAGADASMTAAIVLCVGVLVVIALIMFVSLFALRSTVKNAVRDYNRTMQWALDDIQSSLRRFAKYLSASCNTRRGYAIQEYASRDLDEYTKSLRIRKKHQEDIRKQRAILMEEYRDYFGDQSYCDETMSMAYDYDFDRQIEYTYPAPFLVEDSRRIEFISSGNYVTVPSSYIESILVKMEGIYEQ